MDVVVKSSYWFMDVCVDWDSLLLSSIILIYLILSIKFSINKIFWSADIYKFWKHYIKLQSHTYEKCAFQDAGYKNSP